MTPDLHDATLDSIGVDWPGRLATVTFRRGDSTATAVVSSLIRLDLPRAEPWGPSSSVNSIEQTGEVGVAVRLSLEMQSGDVLVAEVAGVEWVIDEQSA